MMEEVEVVTIGSKLSDVIYECFLTLIGLQLLEEKKWRVKQFFEHNFSINLKVTCVADSLLDPVRLILFEWSVDDVCRRYSTSLNTFLSPPPGLCLMLANDPILLSTFRSILCSIICSKEEVRGRAKKIEKVRQWNNNNSNVCLKRVVVVVMKDIFATNINKILET